MEVWLKLQAGFYKSIGRQLCLLFQFLEIFGQMMKIT